jgi:superfamily II DNA/RNA helicase
MGATWSDIRCQPADQTGSRSPRWCTTSGSTCPFGSGTTASIAPTRACSDRREAIKRAFNADPLQEPLRILICTDAAREGINLQAHCHDLIHIDLPWNPARLEQRNGRIDRKLQPSPKVWCRYFVFEQREEDIVLNALVKKTDRIRTQLGSVGEVIADLLQREGIRRARELAAAVEAEDGGGRTKLARAEMDDASESGNRRFLAYR